MKRKLTGLATVLMSWVTTPAQPGSAGFKRVVKRVVGKRGKYYTLHYTLRCQKGALQAE